jgi:hypothetical protein
LNISVGGISKKGLNGTDNPETETILSGNSKEVYQLIGAPQS